MGRRQSRSREIFRTTGQLMLVTLMTKLENVFHFNSFIFCSTSSVPPFYLVTWNIGSSMNVQADGHGV